MGRPRKERLALGGKPAAEKAPGPGRGGRRGTCGACGTRGHRKSDCQFLVEVDADHLPPRVTVVAGARFRVVEDFEDPEAGARFGVDEVWVAKEDLGGGRWRLEGAGRTTAAWPALHPFQPVPRGGTTQVPRVGMGRLAGWEDEAAA